VFSSLSPLMMLVFLVLGGRGNFRRGFPLWSMIVNGFLAQILSSLSMMIRIPVKRYVNGLEVWS
jgi:hypothetical protein